MPSAIKIAIAKRKAAKAASAKNSPGGRAAVIAAADRTARKSVRSGNGGMGGGFSFKGSGRSALYRGAAGKVARAGGGAIAAHKAGLSATYVG